MKWTYGFFAIVMLVSIGFAALPAFTRQMTQVRVDDERFLQTQNWVISVKPLGNGRIYSVYSRHDQPLPVGLSDKEIEARYPDLYAGLHAPLAAFHALTQVSNVGITGMAAAEILR